MPDETTPIETPPTEPTETPTDWRAALPEEIREAACLTDIGSVDDLAKSYVNVQPRIGMDKLAIPGSEDSKGWDELWNRIGRPEAATGYEKPQEGLPDGVAMMSDDELGKHIWPEFHRLGITKQQAAGLVRMQMNLAAEQQKGLLADYEAEQGKAVEALKGQWGAAFDQNLALAQEVVRRFGGMELAKYLDESGLGNDPRLAEAFRKIGKAISEDEIVGTGSGSPLTKTPAEANVELAALETDKEFLIAYEKKNHPGHATAVQKYNDLMELAFPEPVKE